jgi:preprotein translocase subunit SecG
LTNPTQLYFVLPFYTFHRSIVFGIFTFLLVIVSLVIVLLVLMQKSKDGGMGSALGGGAVEATFGGEAGNVLTRWTIGAAIIFFVLAFGLYLGHIYEYRHGTSPGGSLPTLAAPASAPAPAPTTGTTPVTVPSTAPATTAPAATGATTAPAAGAPATSTPGPEAPKKQP